MSPQRQEEGLSCRDGMAQSPPGLLIGVLFGWGEEMQITYDDRSFLIDGKRIWLVAGEIHYFRLPRAEWREALLRAKRAGLNTVSTYVAWNFHEEREGQPDFSGGRDLAHYIDLIGELGMYAMVRPGPYICSEWDGGGLPAWLCAGQVRRFREDDPVYMHAVERWFDALLPIIAARQVTRGGPVITVQNENEYPGGWDESMRRYIRKLNDMFARHGIDVPILACNVHAASETAIQINSTTVEADQYIDPKMILTYNHYTETEQISELRRRQPHAPLVVTEYWSGAPLYWGNRVDIWPTARDQARAAYEYTAAGAQVDYYMFEGGTNFGFWGGNNIAATYAAAYPVGNAGALTEKYYAIRPVNLLLNRFGSQIAESIEDKGCKATLRPENTQLTVRRGSDGAIVWLSTPVACREAELTLPGGKRITVPLGDVPACALPLELKLYGATVDYSNLCLLAKDDDKKALLLFGPAGTEGVVSIDGNEASITVIRRAVRHVELSGVTVVVMDEEMAKRCWLADGEIVIGPDYVGERNGDGTVDIAVSEAMPEVLRLGQDGKPVELHVELTAHDRLMKPKLGLWKALPCTEAVPDSEDGWSRLEAPYSHEKLGITQGYVWYAAEYSSDRDCVEHLLISNAPNRVSVFVNGKYMGTHAAGRSVRMRDEYGHPADWAFEELTVQLRKGKNTLVFLSDDLGHNYDVPVPVGIQGPVLIGSRRVEVTELTELPPQPVSAAGAYFLHCRDYRSDESVPVFELSFPLKEDQCAFLVIHGVHAWLTAEGRDILPLTWPQAPWTMFAQIKPWLSWALPQPGPGGMCRVRIQAPGWRMEEVLEHMAVYTAPKSGELTGWRWKEWKSSTAGAVGEAVKNQGGVDGDPLVLLPVFGGLRRKAHRLAPVFFEAEFDLPQSDGPVFFHPGEMRKGQIFLNGRNVCRFWQIGGTQEQYYLPRSWMMDRNKLIVFEELGVLPQKAELVSVESKRRARVKL